jgi:hypothetical protein
MCKPFMSRLGYIGLGPAHLSPGDQICILCGAIVPFLLRPRRDSKSKYLVIGEAYVHGIMDGEYIERKPEREYFVDFELH